MTKNYLVNINVLPNIGDKVLLLGTVIDEYVQEHEVAISGVVASIDFIGYFIAINLTNDVILNIHLSMQLDSAFTISEIKIKSNICNNYLLLYNKLIIQINDKIINSIRDLITVEFEDYNG